MLGVAVCCVLFVRGLVQLWFAGGAAAWCCFLLVLAMAVLLVVCCLLLWLVIDMVGG